jgi:hypothetical protein
MLAQVREIVVGAAITGGYGFKLAIKTCLVKVHPRSTKRVDAKRRKVGNSMSLAFVRVTRIIRAPNDLHAVLVDEVDGVGAGRHVCYERTGA